MNVLRQPVLLAALSLALSLPAQAQNPNYTYTLLADTSAGPFAGSSGFSRPSINANGTVAFIASTSGGGQSVFTSDGVTVTTIADTRGPLGGFLGPTPVINDSGTVAFRADLRAGGQTLFTGSGGALTTVASTNPGVPFTSFGNALGINNSGTVAFGALGGISQGFGIGQGVFTSSGGVVTTIADNRPGSPFSFFNVSGGLPSLNDAGTVAFVASGFDNRTGLFTGDGTGAYATIAAPSGPIRPTPFSAPSINAGGTVAFQGSLATGGGSTIGIFTGSGGALTAIALSGGSVSFFGALTSINRSGTVAYVANFVGGGLGIFTGAGSETSDVIRTGDQLFGSTVTDLAGLGSQGLNDLGQLAFTAFLVDGRRVVVRADPTNLIPEPGTIALLAALAVPCVGVVRRRRRAR